MPHGQDKRSAPRRGTGHHSGRTAGWAAARAGSRTACRYSATCVDFRRNILDAMQTGWRDHGDLVRYRLGPVVVHGVSSPELAGEVLTDSATYGKLGPDNPLRLDPGRGPAHQRRPRELAAEPAA